MRGQLIILQSAVCAIVLCADSLSADEVIRERNKRNEVREKDNVRKRFPLEKGYYVGFSRTIHFRDGARSTYEIWSGQWANTAKRAGKDIYADYTRVKTEADRHGINIDDQKPIDQDQLYVEHWEGNQLVNTKTPPSWIFWAVWKIPGKGAGSTPAPTTAPEGVDKPDPSQRWRYVSTSSPGEFIIEWYDPQVQKWSGKALEDTGNGTVALNPLKEKYEKQRWQFHSAGKHNQLIVSQKTNQVLDYHGRAPHKFQANVTNRIGNQGKFGQVWILVKTPTRDEIGIWNAHAKRYLGYDAASNTLACE